MVAEACDESGPGCNSLESQIREELAVLKAVKKRVPIGDFVGGVAAVCEGPGEESEKRLVKGGLVWDGSLTKGIIGKQTTCIDQQKIL